MSIRPHHFANREPLDSLLQSGSHPVTIRWLGTAGFELKCDGTTLLIDPYITRVSLLRLLAFPLRSAEVRVTTALPAADGVLVSHSHFDHALDVPGIVRRTGARVWGSVSTANLLRASGVGPSRIHSCRGGEDFRLGPFQITVIRSRHVRSVISGKVPFDGDIPVDCRLPLHGIRYRCGQVFTFSIRVNDLTICHWCSTDLIDAAVEPAHIDVLLLGISGRQATPDFIARVLDRLVPRVVVPTHYDNFFRPADRRMRVLPSIDFEGFVEEVHDANPDIEIVTLPLDF